MTAPSDTDPLLLFPSESDLQAAQQQTLQAARMEAALSVEAETVGQSLFVSPPDEQRSRGRIGRALIVGSIAIGLSASVGWLLVRPASTVGGMKTDRQPIRALGDEIAVSADLALAGGPRRASAKPAAAAGEPVTSAPADAPVSAPLPVPAVPEIETVAGDAAVQLTVGDSGVGTDVVDRQLVGRSETFSLGSRVVFWTLVLGGGPGDAIRHVWLRNGTVVSIATLPIGSPAWRTQSRVRPEPGETANWVVEARDNADRVLARHQFRTESS